MPGYPRHSLDLEDAPSGDTTRAQPFLNCLVLNPTKLS